LVGQNKIVVGRHQLNHGRFLFIVAVE